MTWTPMIFRPAIYRFARVFRAAVYNAMTDGEHGCAATVSFAKRGGERTQRTGSIFHVRQSVFRRAVVGLRCVAGIRADAVDLTFDVDRSVVRTIHAELQAR